MPYIHSLPTSLHRVMVPVFSDYASEETIALARHIHAQIILVGIVPTELGENLSTKTQIVSELRTRLELLAAAHQHQDRPPILVIMPLVTHSPWLEVRQLIIKERVDLLCLPLPYVESCAKNDCWDFIARASCNIALVKGIASPTLERVLVPQRGGPHAELSLRLAISLGVSGVQVLHIESPAHKTERSFLGFLRILPQLKGVISRLLRDEEPTTQIIRELKNADLVIMGASAQKSDSVLPIIGNISSKIIEQSTCPVVLVRSPLAPTQVQIEQEEFSYHAISLLVDRWFAENTYHGDEFQDLQKLAALKHRTQQSVSVVLPTLNEEETLPEIIQQILPMTQGENPIIDEVVVIDSHSQDRTRDIARDAGLSVYIHQELLPELRSRTGKGEALWKSLLITRGDIILWLDTDVKNFHPRFVYGLLGPLLANPAVSLVKGFYRRPLEHGMDLHLESGGRVTELCARPLLNLFYPELSGVIQPLSGEYGGRRSLLEKLPFFSGYGVETGLLIDTFNQVGLQGIAQVNLIERVHRNQSLQDLSKMAFAITQVVIKRLEQKFSGSFIDDINKSMKLIKTGEFGYMLDVVEIIERERPPMTTLNQYQAKKTDIQNSNVNKSTCK